MNEEQIKMTLTAKVEQEFNVFKSELVKNHSKEEIIKNAFEIAMKDEIQYLIPVLSLSKNEMKALLKMDNILDTLYKNNAEGKTNPLETFQELVVEDISDIADKFEKNKQKNDR